MSELLHPEGYSGNANVLLTDAAAEGLPDLTRHGNTFACPLIIDLQPTLTGCEYGCLYCCAWGQEREAKFEPVIVPVNYPQKVADYIDLNPHSDKTTFYFAPKTDAFAPALVDTGITAGVLRVFADTRAPYVIVTKGGRLTDEIVDLLSATKDKGQVNISQGMPNEEVRQRIEPNAPSIAERYQLAQRLTDEGITVAGMVEPIIPFSDLDFVEGIMDEFLQRRVNHFAIDFARLSENALERVCSLLPDTEAEFIRSLYRQLDSIAAEFLVPGGNTVRRLSPPLNYMREKFNLIKEVVVQKGATVSICNSFAIKRFNREALLRGYNCMGIRSERW